MPATSIKIHSLVFKDKLFCDGLNLTIRRGTKWAGRLELGDAIKLISQEGTYLGAAEVNGIICLPYQDITPSLLSLSTCHTLQELDKYMLERYPDFTEEELVSMIIFKVVEPEEGSF